MNSALGLAAGRVAIGGVALAAPEIGAKLFRLDPVGNPHLPYMIRMFGSREVVLGAATLLARGRTRRNLVLAGIAVDVADTAAAVLAGEARQVERPTQAILAAAAGLAVITGLAGLRRGN